MATKLDKTLKREIAIGERPYIVAITPEGLKLTGKGKRKGHELKWVDLVSGEAALAVALNASLQRVGADTGSDSSGASAGSGGRTRQGAGRSSASRKGAALSGTGRKGVARSAAKKRAKR